MSQGLASNSLRLWMFLANKGVPPLHRIPYTLKYWQCGHFNWLLCWLVSSKLYNYPTHFNQKKKATAWRRYNRTQRLNINRKHAPSELEIKAVLNHKDAFTCFVGLGPFPKNNELKIEIDNSTTVDETIAKCAKRAGLGSNATFGLFAVYGNPATGISRKILNLIFSFQKKWRSP